MIRVKRTKMAKRVVSGFLSIVMSTALILFAVNAGHTGLEHSYTAVPAESEPVAASESSPASGNGLDLTNRHFLHAADADLSIGTSERHMLYQSQDTEISQAVAPDTDRRNTGENKAANLNSSKNTQNQSAVRTSDADSKSSSAISESDEQKHTKKKDKQVPDSSRKTFQTVTSDYFSDALFIGDSRTVGMFQSHLLPEAAYYAKTGIGIGDILTDPIVNEDGVMISVAEALSRHSFGKVYIMIGINDIARGDVEWFTEQYKKILDTVRRTQPDAVIYIQGNIPMSYRTQDLDGALNNRNLSLRDKASQTLADSEHIFYLDISSIYADANGHLASDYTRDGLHVCTDDYPLWVDYLLQHAIVPT